MRFYAISSANAGFREPRRNLLPYLKLFGNDTRPHQRLHPVRVRTEPNHLMHRPLSYSGHSSAPSGMNGSGHAGLFVNQHKGEAVGGIHPCHYSAQVGHYGVNSRKLSHVNPAKALVIIPA